MEKGSGEAILSEVARWNLGLGFSDIPKTVLRKAQCQILSVLASVYAGRSLGQARAVMETVRDRGKRGKATVLASGERATAEDAVLANTTLSMAHDFDDYLFMGHTGHSAVLVSLALCDEMNKDVADLVTCQVAANEIAGRLGTSALLGPLNGQMWSFIHLVASSCIAGKLLDLGQEQMENAIGISLSQPLYPSRSAFFGSGAKLLTASWPSLLGLQSAFLAREGMTGPRDVFDPDGGFYQTFSFYPIRGAWEGLGKRWLTETLAVKRFPGCAYLDSTVDAVEVILERIRQERGKALAPSEVETIRIHATVLTCEMERLAEQYEKEGLHPVLVNFSARYSLAWRLLTGGLRAQEMTEERVKELEGDLRSLAERIHVLSDRALNLELMQSQIRGAGLGKLLHEMGLSGLFTVLRKASGQYTLREHLFPKGRGEKGARQTPFWQGSPKGWIQGLSRLIPSGPSTSGKRYSLEEVLPEALEFPFGARVEVRLKDGSVFAHEQRVPEGAPGNNEADLLEIAGEKFRSHAEDVLGADGAEEALKKLLELSPHQKMRKLVRALAPAENPVS